MAMELAVVAMKPLISKLSQLLSDEYNLGKKVKKGVGSLNNELMMMQAALLKVADIPRDQLDGQVRVWAGKVKELSYEMEDAVDAFMVRVQESPDADAEAPTIKKKVKKFLKKSTRLFTKGKDLHQISDAIKETQDLAKELGELRQRYGLLEMQGASSSVAIDPRLRAMYKDITELVGVDGTRDELVEMLTGGEDWKKKKLKTVSVVGFGGLGKTTLAKAVYDKIKVQFDCGAFVPVSQSPDIKKVLKDILYELDKYKYGEIQNTSRSEKHLLDELTEFLDNKRYIIVIDDIWDEKVWGFIKCAFSPSSLGSRLITTTRKVNVAEACTSSCPEDVIYRMKPLSDDDSQRLFYRRIFKSQTGCPQELEEVSKGILKKCDGVPLAIITIASLLASNQKIKTKEQWHVLLNSIGCGLAEGDSVKEMQRILSFSYYDLPSQLKTCLLYLSIFPEDRKINRDRLIWKWIAEGLIQCEEQGTSMFELGNDYFNELVNRSMIQLVDIRYDGRAEACRVHDMVLDLIRSLAKEENFVTILDGIHRIKPDSQSKIRRLSLQKGMEYTSNPQFDTSSMSQVRSVTLFGPAIDAMPSLSSFGVLRVLDLEGCMLSESWFTVNLKYIGKLLHLRYLKVDCFFGEKIPVEVGKLQHLQFLDLRGSHICEFPSSAILPRNLLSLNMGYDVKMPVGFGKLVSLEELHCMRVDSSQNSAEELGHLTELRVLGISLGEFDARLEKVMVESFGKLRKLQFLFIYDTSNTGVRTLMLDGWVPGPRLRVFYSGVQFRTMPTWINSSSLPLLSRLNITVGELQEGNIQVIGKLPALCMLELGVRAVDMRAILKEGCVVSTDSFPCVKYCRFFGSIQILPSMIPRGAMPMVESLEFSILEYDCDLDLGMGHLPSLSKIEVVLPETYGTARKRAEDALWLAADAHPNHPSLHIRGYTRRGEWIMKLLENAK